jgi:hypothetical protein
MDTPTALSSELRRLPLSHYAFYLLSSLTSTPCLHICVNTSIHPILVSLVPLLSALVFFYLFRDLHPTPLSHYLLLSTQTYLLGFLAQRLPFYLFKDPESANIAQFLFLHFSLAFNFTVDIEWIRLGIMSSDNSFLFPDLINNPFEHSFREFWGRIDVRADCSRTWCLASKCTFCAIAGVCVSTHTTTASSAPSRTRWERILMFTIRRGAWTCCTRVVEVG